MKNGSSILAAAALCLPLALAGSAASEVFITPEMDKHVMRGLDAIYEMNFDASEAEGLRVIELAPEHPIGYFALGAVEFVRFIYDTEQTDQNILPQFERRMRTAISKSESWVKKHPADSQGLMLLASSYGVWSRLLVMRKQWIKAFIYGRKAVKIMKKAVAADPENYDAYIGVGMYDYYSDAYPHFIGALAKLVLHGNRKRGIKILSLVADKGRYTKVAAQLLLIEIYIMDRFDNKDPEHALRILDDIRKRYPVSAMIHGAQLIALYEAERYEQVLEGANAFQAAVNDGRYRPIDAAKGYVILGTAYWALGKLQEAVAAYDSGADIRLKGQLSRWSVWALIRSGQLADLMAAHDKARRSFRAAASEPDYWGLRVEAKPYVRKPFKKQGHPGSIYPLD